MGIERRQLTEPVMHPEVGRPFTLWEQPPGSGNVIVDGPILTTEYDKQEVLELGLGDFSMGVSIIGKGYYKAPASKLGADNWRLFHSELKPQE